MAEIEAGLYAALTKAGGRVAGLVSDRVYPAMIPQEAALPAIAYQKVSGPRERYHNGPAGWARARIQITVMAEKYTEAKAVAGVVRDLFPFRGELGGLVNVAGSWVENEVDGWGPQIEAPTVRIDVFFLYSE